jgi:exonuclease III
MTVITTVTLNRNGFTAPTSVGMLTECLRRHDIDNLFVQEVTSTEVLQIRGYETYQNVGASVRGTAFLAKHGHHLENIIALPSGFAIAAAYQGIRLINILVYAPMRTDREKCFNAELPSPSVLITNV